MKPEIIEFMSEQEANQLRKRFMAILRKKDLSMVDIAKQMDLSVGTVHGFLNGNKKMWCKTWAKIVNYLDKEEKQYFN